MEGLGDGGEVDVLYFNHNGVSFGMLVVVLAERFWRKGKEGQEGGILLRVWVRETPEWRSEGQEEEEKEQNAVVIPSKERES